MTENGYPGVFGVADFESEIQNGRPEMQIVI